MGNLGISEILEKEQLETLIASAGVDVTRAIVDALTQSNAELLQALSAALTQNDLCTAASTAHAMKGSSANLGAVLLASRAKQIEFASKAGNLAEALEAMALFEGDIAATNQAFAEFLNAEAA
jgi:HPt (histidine-containing phosphotransfer) domain-containing protein